MFAATMHLIAIHEPSHDSRFTHLTLILTCVELLELRLGRGLTARG